MSSFKSLEVILSALLAVGAIIAGIWAGFNQYSEIKQRFEKMEQQVRAHEEEIQTLKRSLSNSIERTHALEAGYTSLVNYTKSIAATVGSNAPRNVDIQRCYQLSDQLREVNGKDVARSISLQQELNSLLCPNR